MRIFIDIETVAIPVDNVPETYIKRFSHKLATDQTIEEHYIANAALYAEFGRIVCVSLGFVHEESSIRLKSFCSDNEQELLVAVAVTLLNATTLVAHNGIDFDYPFLCRRMIINKVNLPPVLQIQGLKPWEIKLEDTVQMWKFGQFGHKVSLALMCDLFGLPSPKADMDGSRVADEFHACNYDRIARYCEGDVRSLVNVYRMLNSQEPILETPKT